MPEGVLVPRALMDPSLLNMFVTDKLRPAQKQAETTKKDLSLIQRPREVTRSFSRGSAELGALSQVVASHFKQLQTTKESSPSSGDGF